MMEQVLQLRVRDTEDGLELLSPEVGLFTCALPAGRVVIAGEQVGRLKQLERSYRLMVPEGITGVVRSACPERVHEPVGWGSVLYELGPLEGEALHSSAGPAAGGDATGRLLLRAPQSGRFWHRATPSDPPFASPGDALEPGQAVGLIEIMKTFAPVPYRGGGGLPERARLVRFAVEDGADVAAGDPLIEVEPV